MLGVMEWQHLRGGSRAVSPAGKSKSRNERYLLRFHPRSDDASRRGVGTSAHRLTCRVIWLDLVSRRGSQQAPESKDGSQRCGRRRHSC